MKKRLYLKRYAFLSVNTFNFFSCDIIVQSFSMGTPHMPWEALEAHSTWWRRVKIQRENTCSYLWNEIDLNIYILSFLSLPSLLVLLSKPSIILCFSLSMSFFTYLWFCFQNLKKWSNVCGWGLTYSKQKKHISLLPFFLSSLLNS